MKTPFRHLLLPICILALAAAATAQSSPPLSPSGVVAVPENLGLGLKQLVEASQRDQLELQSQLASVPSINADASGRVVANIQLNGDRPVADVQAALLALGVEIIAVDEHWRSGVISVRLALSQAVAAANLPGVRSIVLARRPIRRVGAVTAGSSAVEHAAQVNTPGIVTPQGILGRGISVGIISDSFDGATGVPRASVGVASGDLPGAGNPDGYTQPVVVLADDNSSDATDEGRAMAEVVHDIAPAAKICFATSGNTQASMANVIRNLRTSPQTLCDVIVDDIGFADEPFFSDGIISQAINDVVTSNSLAGKKVAFFSAAGNSDNHGYTADANIISPDTTLLGNVKLNQAPSSLYAGGLQNLNPTGNPAVVMTVTNGSDPTTLVLQWDDPFNTGGITTDYNLLVFNSSGTYLSSVSGRDNNFSTSEPIETVDLNANTTYQFVISLASPAPPAAKHLRMIAFGEGTATSPYLTSNVITLVGHAAAANANAVAAYVYDNTPNVVSGYNPNKTNPPPGPYEPALESFSARGGNLPFYFNSQGQRLSSPEIRQKPEFAAADGVDTSFFPPGAGADYDNDGFPNFFGTSAAAPSAAGFAALLLEAAGGPSSLTPAQVRTALIQSGFPHDLDPNTSQATITNGSRSVTLTAIGDDSNDSATSPTFFTLAFNGQAGDTLDQLVIDLSNTGLVFDPRTDLGFPFTLGQNNGGVSVSNSLSADMRVLTLSFGNTFTPGKVLAFGIDRDLAAISAGGNSADLLGGASVIATMNGQTFYGALGNQLGRNFVATDGNGLIDARAAVESIVGKSPSSSGAPVNLSTRGNIGLGENVLIGGLIIDGSAAKKVILRAIGPSLTSDGVSGALPDPTLELRDKDGNLLSFDDNWQDDPVQASQIQATGIPPSDPRESAIVRSLSPGNYTAIVRGSNNSTGIGVVEAYDLDSQPASSRLANIATRGTVLTGDNAMIAGFILKQSASQVVVRAIGPSLTSAGVSGALPDPRLELRDSQGNLLSADDNWQEDAFQAVQLTAIGLAPASATESALTTTLGAGNYTAIVRGSHGTTGVGLVEVYSLH